MSRVERVQGCFHCDCALITFCLLERCDGIFALWAIKPCSLRCSLHLYADDVCPVSGLVIIGPTICKGLKYTPLFLSLTVEVCEEVCLKQEYPCERLSLNVIVCEIQSVERQPSSGWLGRQSRPISDVNLKMKDISHVSSPPLWAHSSDTERLFIYLRSARFICSPPEVALLHFCPYSATIDPLSQVSISFPEQTAP